MTQCPKCGSMNIIHNGVFYHCKTCGNEQLRDRYLLTIIIVLFLLFSIAVK